MLFAVRPTYRSGTVQLRVRKNDVGYSRIVCAPIRKFKPAPARNKAKRIIREFFRCNKESIVQGVDIAFILGGMQDDLRQHVHQLMLKADLM